jgi:hypothetical protein
MILKIRPKIWGNIINSNVLGYDKVSAPKTPQYELPVSAPLHQQIVKHIEDGEGNKPPLCRNTSARWVRLSNILRVRRAMRWVTFNTCVFPKFCIFWSQGFIFWQWYGLWSARKTEEAVFSVKKKRCISMTGCMLLFPILNQTNTLHAFKSYLFKIHFNIIILFTPWYSKWIRSFRFPHQKRACISLLSQPWHTPSPKKKKSSPIYFIIFVLSTSLLFSVRDFNTQSVYWAFSLWPKLGLPEISAGSWTRKIIPASLKA